MSRLIIYSRNFALLFLLIITVAACSPDLDHQNNQSTFDFELNAVLGGDDTEGFLRADAPRTFSFPQDHGLHPGFRNEWWYLTGNLRAENGQQFGYQVTFFATSFTTSLNDGSESSAWQSPRIWMAHAALTDVDSNRHIALERFSRENPGLAGAQLNPFRVWLENWSLSSESNEFPWTLDINDDAFALALTLNPLKAPVLQGEQGLSQKSPEIGNASYYYSLTRLASSGEIILDGQHFQVEGQSWLDREWSTSALADDQSGWDWFSLQFNDGQELMYYQLRDKDGNAHPSSDGNWTDINAQQSPVSMDDITLTENRNWLSPSGISYTTEWAIQYAGQEWLVRALVDDQFMDLSVPYWEGAVEILSATSGEVVGQGYLEMVRN